MTCLNNYINFLLRGAHEQLKKLTKDSFLLITKKSFDKITSTIFNFSLKVMFLTGLPYHESILKTKSTIFPNSLLFQIVYL